MDQYPRVAVAYLHPGSVSGDFCRSLTDTILQYPGLVVAHLAVASGANISWARNQVVEAFLKSDCDWLWMVDSDMTWQPDALASLLAAADPTDRPVMGGLCFAAYREPSGYRMRPTLYEFRDNGLATASSYPDNTVGQVDATGAAFLLVHRSVFERFPEMPMRWFQESIVVGRLRGEDITFCHRLGELDVPIFVHTGVKVGHVKQVVLDESMYQWQKESERGDQ